MGKRVGGGRVRYRKRDRPNKATREIPAHLKDLWPIIYLTTIRRVARYEEVRRFWDLAEVLDAIEALDIMDDLAHDQAEIDRQERERRARK
jgi:hypothetical protein